MEAYLICGEWIAARNAKQHMGTPHERKTYWARFKENTGTASRCVFFVLSAAFLAGIALFALNRTYAAQCVLLVDSILFLFVLYPLSCRDDRLNMKQRHEDAHARIERAFRGTKASGLLREESLLYFDEEITRMLHSKEACRRVVTDRAFHVFVISIACEVLLRLLMQNEGDPAIDAFVCLCAVLAALLAGSGWDLYDGVQASTVPLRQLRVIKDDLFHLKMKYPWMFEA